jgi:hypothetical protein
MKTRKTRTMSRKRKKKRKKLVLPRVGTMR